MRDFRGLILTPTLSFAESPQLDVLLLPGDNAVNALMEDEETLSFIRNQAAACRSSSRFAMAPRRAAKQASRRGDVRQLIGRLHLLSIFGAWPVPARVVADGFLVTAKGVTSGLDAALRVAAALRRAATASKSNSTCNTRPNRLSIAALPNPLTQRSKPCVTPCALFPKPVKLARSEPRRNWVRS